MESNNKTLKQKLSEGKFVVTCEISPPRGSDISKFEEMVKGVLKKVDAINITDNPLLSVRMSTLGASIVAMKLGAEPIYQLTCRDRNILAITSDLLAAWSFGVKNVLALYGDVPKETDSSPKPVFEVDTYSLMKTIVNMNNGLDFRGKDLQGKTDFFIGGTLNPYDSKDRVISGLQKKVQSGARFFQSQPLFSMNTLEWLSDSEIGKGVYIILGVMIVLSEKTISMLKKLAPFMSIPEEVEQKFYDLKNPDDKKNYGVDLATEVSLKIRDSKLFSGVHIMSPADETLIQRVVSNL